MINRRRLPNVV